MSKSTHLEGYTIDGHTLEISKSWPPSDVGIENNGLLTFNGRYENPSRVGSLLIGAKGRITATDADSTLVIHANLIFCPNEDGSENGGIYEVHGSVKAGTCSHIYVTSCAYFDGAAVIAYFDEEPPSIARYRILTFGSNAHETVFSYHEVYVNGVLQTGWVLDYSTPNEVALVKANAEFAESRILATSEMYAIYTFAAIANKPNSAPPHPPKPIIISDRPFYATLPSPDGRYLYTLRDASIVEVRLTSSKNASDIYKVKHQLKDVDLEYFIQHQKGAIFASPDGKFLYILGHEDTVYQYKTQDFEDKAAGETIPYTPFTLENATLESMALTPDCSRLYVGDSAGKGRIAYFDPKDSSTNYPISSGYSGTPMILATSLKGDIYIANKITNDNRTYIYKIKAGNTTARYLGQAAPGEVITDIMVNGDGTALYAAISDHTYAAAHFNTETGEENYISFSG